MTKQQVVVDPQGDEGPGKGRRPGADPAGDQHALQQEEREEDHEVPLGRGPHDVRRQEDQTPGEQDRGEEGEADPEPDPLRELGPAVEPEGLHRTPVPAQALQVEHPQVGHHVGDHRASLRRRAVVPERLDRQRELVVLGQRILHEPGSGDAGDARTAGLRDLAQDADREDGARPGQDVHATHLPRHLPGPTRVLDGLCQLHEVRGLPGHDRPGQPPDVVPLRVERHGVLDEVRRQLAIGIHAEHVVGVVKVGHVVPEPLVEGACLLGGVVDGLLDLGSRRPGELDGSVGAVVRHHDDTVRYHGLRPEAADRRLDSVFLVVRGDQGDHVGLFYTNGH